MARQPHHNRRRGGKPQRGRTHDRGPARPKTQPTTPEEAHALIQLKQLARDSIASVSADDEPRDNQSPAESTEAALFTALDLVAAVRVAPRPPKASRTLTGELELVGDHHALSLLLILAKLGGLPHLRDNAARAVKALADKGIRSRSESVVLSLVDPEPLCAWKLTNEDGGNVGLWCAVTGPDNGARVLAVAIEEGRATSAVLDCIGSRDEVETHVRKTAEGGTREPEQIEWQTARELLATVWHPITPEPGTVNEATYLRPWIERAILRGIKPPAPDSENAAQPPETRNAPALIVRALDALGAPGEDAKTALHVWADFETSFPDHIPDNQRDEWAAAAVMAVVSLADRPYSTAQIAEACGIPEDDLLEIHDEFWEIMAVEVPDDVTAEDDEADDELLTLLPPEPKDDPPDKG